MGVLLEDYTIVVLTGCWSLQLLHVCMLESRPQIYLSKQFMQFSYTEYCLFSV